MRQVKSLLRTVKKNLEWSVKKKLPAQKSPVTSSSFLCLFLIHYFPK